MNRRTMLDTILDARAEEIATLHDEDYKFMETSTRNNTSFTDLANFIKTLHLEKSIMHKLMSMLDDVESVSSSEFAHFTDKYYKAGFSDAVNIIFDALEYKK